nr:reverse transcriptase domain-containing protein [Tanacetum cinerariifolium]
MTSRIFSKDSLNATAGGNILNRTPRDALTIIENKSKVRTSRNKPVVSKASATTSSSTPTYLSEITALTDAVKAMLLQNKTPSPASVKGPTILPTSSPLSKEVEREPEATKDKVQTTSSGSTAHVQPMVFQVPIPEPDVAPKPNPKPLHFDLSFADALFHMPKFASTLKSLLSNKNKLFELENTLLNENCSTMLLKKLPKKLGDPGKFLIPCDFPELEECLALADLGASINLMPLFVWKKLFLLEPTPTRMTLELANRSVAYPVGVAEDVFVKVGKFHFLAEFVVVDYDFDPRVPLILKRPFLRTERALIDIHSEELTLRFNDESITFNVGHTLRYSYRYDDESVNRINVIDVTCEEYAQEVLGILDSSKSANPTPSLDPIITTFSPSLTPLGGDFILEEIKACLTRDLIPPGIDDADFDPEGDIILLEKLLNDDPSSPLPPKELNFEELKIIKSSIDDPPKLELKDLPSHLDSLCAKKGGITVVMNEDNELIPIRLVTRWRVCIDYRKLSFAIRKDHFSLSFMDQMLERLVGNKYYCVLDGFFEYFQIPIDLKTKRRPPSLALIGRLPIDVCLSAYVMIWACSKGHAGFYRRFIQDFYKITRPMTHLLEKETPFIFLKECIEAFEILKKKLTEAPILVAPDWDLPFEIMCDASDFAMGSVMGKQKELLVVVYAFEKFRSYLVLSKTIVHTDHSDLKYLLAKQDAKLRLLQWILLLQKFDVIIRDKKGAENLTADHLSKLENPHQVDLEKKEINETFPLETLEMISTHGNSSTLWFVDIANYHAGNFVVKGMSSLQKKISLRM